MQEEPTKKSLWERLSKGVTQGWEKARDVSSRLGEMASLKLDIKKARDDLEDRHRLLGKIASDRLIDRGEDKLDSSEPAVRSALDEITSARVYLASLEKKLAEVKESSGDAGEE